MKTFNTVFILVLSSVYGIGQNVVRFTSSKPYSIFNFMEAATGNYRQSSATLTEFISLQTKNDSSFRSLCDDFRKIKIDYTYKRDELPAGRKHFRSTYDLIVISLVSSNTIDEFKAKSIGILPNSEHLRLLTLLKKAELYFDKLIWDDHKEIINKRVTELEAYSEKVSQCFRNMKSFYGSNWPEDSPFIVSVYPIPGSSGLISATPHINSLCVGVLTDQTDLLQTLSVVLHEMCHVLYDEQDVLVQHELEKYFTNYTSTYSSIAHDFFDEGLATALGNGWGYKMLSGTHSTYSWYNNDYINDFGNELYPLVEEYISVHKQIDRRFIEKAIDLFAAKFPKAPFDYNVVLKDIVLYSDVDSESERVELMNTFFTFFRSESINFSSPIQHTFSIQSLKENNKTQLIIIEKNSETNQQALAAIFPSLQKLKWERNTVICFYDKNHRLVIIINAADRSGVKSVLNEMKTSRYFKPMNTQK